MPDKKIGQSGQQRNLSEKQYLEIRSGFNGMILHFLDLVHYGFLDKTASLFLNDSNLKSELISYLDNLLQNTITISDVMIDNILSIKIPTQLMATYNRKMKNSIFEMITRQIVATLKNDQSNKIDENSQKKKNNINITR